LDAWIEIRELLELWVLEDGLRAHVFVEETTMRRYADHRLTNFEYTGFFFFFSSIENIPHHLRNW